MKLLRSMAVAFSMYSRLPMPAVPWTQETMAWSLCCLPAVGAVLGGALAGWCALCRLLGVGRLLLAAGAVLLPLLLTGGIHMDGFCDTCDALGSCQSREKKLEIMKDSRAGAFAVMGCCGYLLGIFALWCEVELTAGDTAVLALVPVLSRTLSAYGALSLPNARGSGLLAAFSAPARQKTGRAVLLILAFFLLWGMGLLGCGMAAAAAAVLIWLCYRHMALREFGGVTGDLAGYFLQMCEGGCLLAVVLAQKVVQLL